MAKTEVAGFAWFRSTAVFFGALYLISFVISRIADLLWPAAPVWLDLLVVSSVFWFIPVAAQVLKMNEGRTELIQKNSKYGWEAWALIASIFVTGVLGVVLLALYT